MQSDPIRSDPIQSNPIQSNQIHGSLSQIMSGIVAVEYHVGPVIRMTYDDETWLHSKVFGFFHPELAIALGQCLLQVIRLTSNHPTCTHDPDMLHARMI